MSQQAVKSDPVARIPLDAGVRAQKLPLRSRSFTIRNDNAQFALYLSADSKEERNMWIMGINAAVNPHKKSRFWRRKK
jgi:hypothetical protein